MTATHPRQPGDAGPIVPKVPHVLYGADYNPEQWDRDVWREDVRLMQEAGVHPPLEAPPGIEVVRRVRGERSFLFVLNLNHTRATCDVHVGGRYRDLLTGATHAETIALDPYGVAILDTRNIATQKTCALLYISLREFFLFAQGAKPVTYDHLSIVTYGI